MRGKGSEIQGGGENIQETNENIQETKELIGTGSGDIAATLSIAAILSETKEKMSEVPFSFHDMSKICDKIKQYKQNHDEDSFKSMLEKDIPDIVKECYGSKKISSRKVVYERSGEKIPVDGRLEFVRKSLDIIAQVSGLPFTIGEGKSRDDLSKGTMSRQEVLDVLNVEGNEKVLDIFAKIINENGTIPLFPIHEGSKESKEGSKDESYINLYMKNQGNPACRVVKFSSTDIQSSTHGKGGQQYFRGLNIK